MIVTVEMEILSNVFSLLDVFDNLPKIVYCILKTRKTTDFAGVVNMTRLLLLLHHLFIPIWFRPNQANSFMLLRHLNLKF